MEILKEKGIGRVQRWLGQRHGTGIRRDDLIDACACALAARDSTRRVPTNGNLINRGAQAEIWY
jgi:predicted RNase H-like nuclease